MLKVLNLSSHSLIRNFLRSKELLNKSSVCFASKPDLKNDEKLYQNEAENKNIKYDEYQTESDLKKEEEFIPNLFLNEIEYSNLSEKERAKYLKFFDLPIYKKVGPYTKIMITELKKFILSEFFDWNFLKEEKIVNDGDTDIKWVFKSKDDLKGWLITCDSLLDQGFSNVNLDVNKQGRLVFSGYLDCDNLPADGKITHTGFAHLSSPFEKGGFGLENYYNWSMFNHLLLRFRGDGRVYRILLRGPSIHGMQDNSFFEYFLYTRGGPYWQTAKIPFSKFILCYQGRIQEKPWPLPANKIQSFSFTLNKYTGPFKLEISHIGLQLDSRNYQQFDYEAYFRPEIK